MLVQQKARGREIRMGTKHTLRLKVQGSVYCIRSYTSWLGRGGQRKERDRGTGRGQTGGQGEGKEKGELREAGRGQKERGKGNERTGGRGSSKGRWV